MLGAAAALAVMATALPAPAAVPLAPAATKVTIKAEGTDLSGRVASPRPARCAAERKVVVFKQRGARGGGDDERFASDTTDEQGGVWVWSTGTTGTEGRFYAKVKRITGCKGDTSPTIRAERND